MRVQRHVVLGGESGDPAERRDAADPHDVRLHDLRRPRIEVLGEAVRGVEVLADGDRHVDAPGELGMAGEVVGPQRLFDPRGGERRERVHRARRTVEVPPLVRVDHEAAVGAEQLAHGGDAVDVLGEVGLADLDLDRVEPGVDPAGDLGERAPRAGSGG